MPHYKHIIDPSTAKGRKELRSLIEGFRTLKIEQMRGTSIPNIETIQKGSCYPLYACESLPLAISYIEQLEYLLKKQHIFTHEQH